jgi:Fe2+ or Zn2+ uptake regulation protein
MQTVANQNPKALFYPTKRKLQVLGLLAEYFVLRSKDLARLLRSPDPSGTDIRTINRTLRILDDAGLVHRLRYLNSENDGVGYACGLTDAGVRFVAEGKTFDEHSERTLDHELGISFFHLSLRELCDNHGFMLRWQQSGLKHGVNPDAYFSVTNPKQEDRNTHHFFLEIERAKIGNYKGGEPSIIRKLKHYYDYYDTARCEEAWGFRTYRVVTILRSGERRSNLLKAMDAALNHRMFWLGVEPNHTTDFKTPRGDRFSFADFW